LRAEVSNHEGCPWLKKPIPQAELAANRKANRQEVRRLIALAKAYPQTVIAVNIGNEALVSWNDHMVTVDAMIAYIRQVKNAIKQPVSTADNYVPWVEHGERLASVVDFAGVHTYPLWEKKNIDEAMPFTIANIQAVRNAIGAVPIVIGRPPACRLPKPRGRRYRKARCGSARPRYRRRASGRCIRRG
jgi:hypothetical protein